MNSVIEEAYSLLRTATPLHKDCGRLCGRRCCQGEETDGMWLFPGEEERFAAWRREGEESFTVRPTQDNLGYPLLVCDGTCNRERRPLPVGCTPSFRWWRGCRDRRGSGCSMTPEDGVSAPWQPVSSHWNLPSAGLSGVRRGCCCGIPNVQTICGRPVRFYRRFLSCSTVCKARTAASALFRLLLKFTLSLVQAQTAAASLCKGQPAAGNSLKV